MMNRNPTRLELALFCISLMGSVFLIVMGTSFTFDHTLAASFFGVPLSGGVANAYIGVAAIRDIAFGCLALVFAVLRDKRAFGLSLLFGSIIPIGDGIVVLQNNPEPLQFLALHWGGAISCIALAAIFLMKLR